MFFVIVVDVFMYECVYVAMMRLDKSGVVDVSHL